MESINKQIEHELALALGKPKYYIDTSGLKENEDYFWFPTLGDSMTDGSSKSIPGGSLVLARRLNLNGVKDVPLHQPIVVIVHYGGEQFCLLKSVYEICSSVTDGNDSDAEMVCLHSYNPRCGDLWIPFNYIKFLFVAEKVRRPNGSEFVPISEVAER